MARQQKSIDSYELQFYLGGAREMLNALGYDEISDDHNPVWQALAGLSPISEQAISAMVEAGEMTDAEADSFARTQREGAELAEALKPFVWRGKTPNKRAILTAYCLCQTACLNIVNGPIGDGSLGTIRQRWYFSKLSGAMGFKFAAQALEAYLVQSADVVLVDDNRAMSRAKEMGADLVMYKSDYSKKDERWLKEKLGRAPRVHTWPKAGWGRTYAQLQSQILSDLVRAGMLYEQLWVRDASRDVATSRALLPDFHAVLLLEKQGLFDHFKGFCTAAGIPVLVAMSGNNAFSAVEAILNDNFRNYDGTYKVSADNPLVIFTITDHDYSGHIPVQDGAVSQFEHYLPNATRKVRIGITPEQVRESGRSPAQAGYEFEVERNSSTQEWAEQEGIWIGDVCYALEVEALEPSVFVPYLIDAIVEAVGGDDELRKRLGEMAEPDWYDVSRRIKRETEALSILSAMLAQLATWSEEKQQEEVSNPISDWVDEQLAEGESEWREREDVKRAIAERVSRQRESISVDDFKRHVQRQSWGSWRPVDSESATRAVVDAFNDDFWRDMRTLVQDLETEHRDERFDDETGEWVQTGLLPDLERVFDVLAPHGLEAVSID